MTWCSVHLAAELAEGADSAVDCFFVKQVAGEGVVAEAHGRAFAVKDFNVLRRSGAGDDKTDCVGASVNRCQLDGSGHDLSPEVRQGVRWLVVRAANTELRGDAFAEIAVHFGDAAFAV